MTRLEPIIEARGVEKSYAQPDGRRIEIGLSHPRQHKAEPFIELVDYIYKVLTQPQVKQRAPRRRRTMRPSRLP